MRVKLSVPEEMKDKSPAIHGEWIGYDGKTGTVICGAGNGGVWVTFNDSHTNYVGCPVKYLEIVKGEIT